MRKIDRIIQSKLKKFKKKRRKNKAKPKFNIFLVLIVMGLFAGFGLITFYSVNMAAVSDDDEVKVVDIKNGSITSIAKTLKKKNLIRNVSVFKIYTRITGKSNLKAGIYDLSEDMGVKKIVKELEKGSSNNPDEISITFKEGLNIRKIAKVISEKTNNSYDDVIKTATDSEYIDVIIKKYWFITDDIKKSGIYYPIEGYLYPDTYRFVNKDVSIKDIFNKMLDEMDTKLTKNKKKVEESSFSVHEMLTLASIVELEGASAKDRNAVAGVFINRLNSSSYPTLGSDATTYYASKIDDWSYSLSSTELDDCSNKYNTRCNSNTGLPVGPICNPSWQSIEAVINPEEHNYYYFVADCKGKVYLSKNSNEHYNIINKLAREGNWCA